MRISTRFLLGFATLAAVACGTDVRDEADPEPAPRATWYQDVAPIIAARCMGCHQPGGVGPFDLTTYDASFENAGRMLDAVAKGVMPPFDAREEEDCTPRFGWVDDPRLTPDEVATLEHWIEDGRAPGTVAAIPDAPDIALQGVTKTLTPVVPFTAQGTRDQFICYVLDPQLPGGAWLTGLQVRPGNPVVVHHVVVNELMPGAEHDALVAQRGIGMPWACGDADVPGIVVNVWTPGNQPFQTSGELAVPLVAGAKLVMQLHYHPAGQVHEPDATSIDLRTSLAWPKKMYFVGAFGNEFQAPALLGDPDDRFATVPEFRVPANDPDHAEHIRITVPSLGDQDEVQLYSVNPHMHMVGTHISARIERPAARGSDPQNECLANGAWNFDWQRTYVYDAALEELPTVRPGDLIDVRCRWNNTMANPFVQRLLHDEGLVAPVDLALGEGSTDEMCLEIFGLAIDAPPPPAGRTAPNIGELPMQLLDILGRN